MAKPQNFQYHKGVSELARECRVSVSTVSSKLRLGKTPDQIREEAEAWHAREQKVEQNEGSESFFEARARKEKLLADLRALELSVKRGELVPIDDVNAFVSTMIVRARDVLTRIGPELRDRLAKESDPVVIQQIVDAETTRALHELSEYHPTE